MGNQNTNSTNSTGEAPPEINVTVSLKGQDALRFLAYKRRELLRANAEAGYKLMFERLRQVEEQAAA